MSQSQGEPTDLESLFAPPEGEHGTHLLLCGLSADAETLERVLAAFTNEPPEVRRDRAWVRALLMLDASAAVAAPHPVPGVLQLAPCVAKLWRDRCTLMHAKVALMGFGRSNCSAPHRWRLVVCTGNWTSATWGSGGQIDMFWSTECNLEQPSPEPHAPADVRTSLKFFERLMAGLYAEHLDMLAQEPLATRWLDVWRERLASRSATSASQRSNFVHSLDVDLMTQIERAFPQKGIGTLVAGSGFFETQRGTEGEDDSPKVLQRLEHLANPAYRYLVFNPAYAGSIAEWAKSRRTSGAKSARRSAAELAKVGAWTLCVPRDPLQKKEGAGRTWLHAKYIAGLRGANAKGDARMDFLYLGSGNLSVRGLLGRARLAQARGKPSGNVEAGVILTESSRIDRAWQRLACGPYASLEELDTAQPGEAEEIFEPQDPPPVLFLKQQEDGLRVFRSASGQCPLLIALSPGQWSLIATDCDVIEQSVNAECPPSVRVRKQDAHGADAPEWSAPVFSIDGLFCQQPIAPLSIENVLQDLIDFPRATQRDDEDEGRRRKSAGVRSSPGADYPLRLLALLVEGIARRNVEMRREEFPYWMSHLRMRLVQQVDAEQRDAIRDLGLDLFTALESPGFVPVWMTSQDSYHQQYADLVLQIRNAWCMPAKLLPGGEA